MTMPGRRKLAVDGKDYFYQLKGEAGPSKEPTSGVIRLVVELKPGRYAKAVFRSTWWTAHIEDGVEDGYEAFTPKSVAAVIRALEFNKGSLPVGFELDGWRQYEPKAAVHSTPKPAPVRPRLGVGTHLTLDDLRALALQQPALSVDYVRARAHMGSCRTCRGMVDRERAENPLLEREEAKRSSTEPPIPREQGEPCEQRDEQWGPPVEPLL